MAHARREDASTGRRREPVIVAVLMLIICAIVWAVSSSTGNATSAARGRVGVFVSIGAAALAGAGVAWLNFLLRVGTTL